jgi:hypothetical protein
VELQVRVELRVIVKEVVIAVELPIAEKVLHPLVV